jgi:hypothetical protein
MICSLNFALALSEKRKLLEVVVSRGVLEEVIMKSRAEKSSPPRLNIKQAQSKLLLHKARWRGILFLHMSYDTVNFDANDRDS